MMTDLQFKAFILALAHEWRTGAIPDAAQWRRLVRAPNGAKAAELDAGALLFADNPLRLKLVDERERQILERQNKAKGQASRTDRGRQAAMTASESPVESVSASVSKSLTLIVKPNEINKTARKDDENLRDSSCLHSELPTDVGNSFSGGGDAHAHAREAATGNSRLGGTLAGDTNSPNGGTLPEDLGDLRGPNDDFATQDAQRRAELDRIYRQAMKLVKVDAGRIPERVSKEISGLMEIGATPENLRKFFGSRKRIPSLDYVVGDYANWLANAEKGANDVSNGNHENQKPTGASTARERTERELSQRDDSDADHAFASRFGT